MGRQIAAGDPFALNFYEKKPVVPCVHYTAFQTWVGRAILPYLHDATAASLNQLYILLTHRYMDFSVSVPKVCRESVGKHGHRCIHAVFIETYQAIRKAELELVPLPMAAQPETATMDRGNKGTLVGLPPIPEDEG